MAKQRCSIPPAGMWQARVARVRYPKRVTLATPFGGLPAGALLFVGTPAIIRDYIARIPLGQTRSIARLRRDLARAHRCQGMCPVSTAIFLRMLAEVAWDQLQEGATVTDVLPFWRVIEPGTPIARRLRVSGTWLKRQRESEAGPRS